MIGSDFKLYFVLSQGHLDHLRWEQIFVNKQLITFTSISLIISCNAQTGFTVPYMFKNQDRQKKQDELVAGLDQPVHNMCLPLPNSHVDTGC